MAEYWSPKFGHDPLAEALHNWSLESFQDDTCGTVDDIGWHALFHVDEPEQVTLDDGTEVLVEKADYILVEDDQGFVSYARFHRPSGDALMAWHGVQAAYDKFYEGEED
jgi:hypothetical protein